MVGVWFDHLEYGLISSIGGLTFLYLPNTPLSRRMVWLMACAFGMSRRGVKPGAPARV